MCTSSILTTVPPMGVLLLCVLTVASPIGPEGDVLAQVATARFRLDGPVESEGQGSEATSKSDTASIFGALDLDGSGKLDKKEVAALAKKNGLAGASMVSEFASMDTNGDGELDESEMGMEDSPKGKSEDTAKEKPAAAAKEANNSSEATSKSDAASTFAALDLDGSGKLDKKEVAALAKKNGLDGASMDSQFASMDTNGDGELDESEMGMEDSPKGKSEDTAKEKPAAAAKEAKKVASAEKQKAEKDAAAEKLAAEKQAEAEKQATDKQAAAERLQAAEKKAAAEKQAAEKQVAAEKKEEEAKVVKEAVQQDSQEDTSDSSSHAFEHAVNTVASPGDQQIRDVVQEASRNESADVLSENAALEIDVRQHAERTVAQLFAHKAASSLSDRSADEAKAHKLETSAEAMRKNATALVQHASADVEQAARKAANEAVKRVIGQVHHLEQLASKEEAAAVKKRGEAKEAMRQAVVAQAKMSGLVHQLNHDSTA